MEINSRKKISLLLSIFLLNILFFRPITSLGFLLIVLTLLAFSSFSSYGTNKRNPIIGSFVVLFCILVVFMFRSYWFVITVSSLFSLCIFVLHLYITHTEHGFFSSVLDLLVSPLRVGTMYIRSTVRTIQFVWNSLSHINTRSSSAETQRNSLIRSILIGLFIGLPVAMILLTFLSDADPIYAHFVRSILNENILHELPARIWFSLCIGLLLFPLLLFNQFSRFKYSVDYIVRFRFINEMIVVSGLVAVVIASFLVIQWPYVFISVPFETNLSSYGISTYSEYVRKGFFELIKVSFFVYVLLWMGLIALRGKGTNAKKFLLAVQSIIMAEFLVFILSIFRRIWLYQLYHGWSLIRIYGGLLVLWLAGITLILALRHFIKKNWVMLEVVWSIVFVLFIGFFNAERFIVRYHPPTVNRRIDYVYLSRMSPDGYAGWKMAYDHAKKVLSKNTADNNPVIAEDARREIAYSGIIISELTRQHLRLLKEYGTMEEIRLYASDILGYQMQSVEKFEPFIHEGYQKESYNQEIKRLNSFKDIKQKNEYGSIMALIKAKYTYYPIFNKPNYPSDLSFFYFDIDSKQPDKRTYPYSGLNRLLLTNLSKMKTYHTMKREIQYRELLRLQKQYFDLSVRIANQPPGQTEYNRDISTDSPLL